MKKAIEEHLPYQHYLNEAYLCYCIELKDIDENRLEEKCIENKIAINPIVHHILKISFASIDTKKINQSISLLSKLIQECCL